MRVERRLARGSLLVWFSAALAGCGGSVGGGSQRDASVEADLPDAAHTSDGAPTTECPETAPSNGASCSHEGLVCEYGTSFDPMCNDEVACTGGMWDESTGACTQDPSCPASFQAITNGAVCTSSGASCYYESGECACEGPADPFPDAGINWYCSAPPDPGCPVPRPREGAPCSMEGQDCYYGGSCGEPDATELDCTQGVWQPPFTNTHGCG